MPYLLCVTCIHVLILFSFKQFHLRFEYFANSALSGLGVEVDEEEVETQGVAVAPIAATHAIDDATRRQIDLLANLTLDDNSDQCMPKVIDSLQGIKIVGASAGHRHSMFLDTHGNGKYQTVVSAHYLSFFLIKIRLHLTHHQYIRVEMAAEAPLVMVTG